MRLVKIKDLGDIVTGNTPSKKIEEFYKSKDILFVKPDAVVSANLIMSDTEDYALMVRTTN